MSKYVKFIGELTQYQQCQLKDSDQLTWSDDRKPKILSGLEALDANNDPSEFSNEMTTRDQLSTSQSPVYIVRPGRTPAYTMLDLIHKYHLGQEIKILYDDSDGDISSIQVKEMDSCINLLRDAGIRVYLGIEDLLKEIKV